MCMACPEMSLTLHVTHADGTVTEYCQPSAEMHLFAMVTYCTNSSAELGITAEDFERDRSNRCVFRRDWGNSCVFERDRAFGTCSSVTGPSPYFTSE